MYLAVSKRMLYLLAAVASATPVMGQFLTPEDTVKIPPPADIPVGPATPAAPAPAQSAPAPQPSAITPPQLDSYFADFAAYPRAKSVILSWHLIQGRTIEKRIQLYRFTEEPKVIHDISKGTLIAKMTGEINIYEDVPPSRGTYYYAIFLETGRGLEPGAFNASRNLVGPAFYQTAGADFTPPAASSQKVTEAQYQRPEFTSNEVDAEDDESDSADERPARASSERGINSVIRTTFLAGDFSGAVRKLKPFYRNSSPKVRAKAIFYTGMARYRLGQYDRALKYFEHALTRKYYRRNAEFWINRTQENLR
ncbi:tetratricopeptide repeat protein [Turneriella parva]|uniref:Tetratricopeptide TPR_2 repeat-containing protein n=1 Tax=Turneriella parva (strain ATCC BAA-1111 / DSM 21527 / NCTC 11395 / H) TaxID=869212 RepID=I4B088_TURPD|nr:tetratricopeptide repeat protein [Turneriella parva]AFM10695.1 Tetratricopeptide TPR_2 repeat-containing protein [Turneriella parva DSM 21527]